ncbi:MAG: ferrous iron transport protein B [Candidatus Omnitrophica bacterium]|nr:ferrous iron transport protein B [Candidatus Omnitrophota bacterium]
MSTARKSHSKRKEVALLGNPNCGKTTVFNGLTGMRHTTGNYPGVTVERRTGTLVLDEGPVTILDLPGTYSLSPHSIDEEIVHNVLLGMQQGTPAPDLVVLILDASNLERNLYLASQVLEIGLPVIFFLNMWNLALDEGMQIDLEKLQELTGVHCIAGNARTGMGLPDLRKAIGKHLKDTPLPKKPGVLSPKLDKRVEDEVHALCEKIQATFAQRHKAACGEALRLISDTWRGSPLLKNNSNGDELWKAAEQVRARLKSAGVDWAAAEAESRYQSIAALISRILTYRPDASLSLSDRLDSVFTHKFWGLVIFMLLMGLVFQSIFSWAEPLMGVVESFVQAIAAFITGLLPEGVLRSLIVDGIIAGVGNVAVFLPQIFLLFFFIALFEDFGYMARAAFVLDRVMKKVGLNGKAFLPLLSSFACAIPGVMATRTIQDPKDRLATILVAPLMSCSARLPVYALMIGAFIPAVPVLGIFDLKGVTLLSMYFLSIIAGLGMAALFRNTLLKGPHSPFVLELPPYRIPQLRSVLLIVWDRSKEFLFRAGTIIFAISIVLWFLANYPKSESQVQHFEQARLQATQTLSGEDLTRTLLQIDHKQASEELTYSFAGRLGKLIEPVIQPLGFDWKIGVGLIASFAAREVLVSTLAIVYNVGNDGSETSVDLIHKLRNQVSPETGAPVYTPLVAISLMVFFVLACQCMSTVAIVRKETNSWRWPLFMIAYMTLLAWLGSFVVFQGGRLLGFS